MILCGIDYPVKPDNDSFYLCFEGAPVKPDNDGNRAEQANNNREGVQAVIEAALIKLHSADEVIGGR